VPQRNRSGLDIGANTHLLGGPNEHRNMPGTGRGEHAGLLGVVRRIVHEPDAVAGNSAFDELEGELVVGVPPGGVGGTDVAEHQLKGTSDG
jgi:hypothetical protein